jgi:DNA (cytosine-5)-methyltransferase 1
MTAYYNEIDLHVAKWLENLIAAGHIAPGVVDTRSIEDVQPDDLRGFTQCHFFAGGGIWSYALRRAGYPDDRSIWTGSCPCQPFSGAGKGAGFADERHLWPAFHHLIRERKPAIVLGEQVASKDAGPWIDLVHTDMEAMGYAFGAVPFPSAGIGAPHIRDRAYWVANAIESERGRRPNNGALLGNGEATGRHEVASNAERDCIAVRLADRDGQRCDGEQIRVQPGRPHEASIEAAGHGGVVRLANSDGSRSPSNEGSQPGVFEGANIAIGSGIDAVRPGPTNGYWRDADWLGCQDGKWRPVEPGTFPLAHGAPARVGRLRAYGNAINAEAAIAWVECVMESI